jgi:hypothetical protein
MSGQVAAAKRYIGGLESDGEQAVLASRLLLSDDLRREVTAARPSSLACQSQEGQIFHRVLHAVGIIGDYSAAEHSLQERVMKDPSQWKRVSPIGSRSAR